MLLIGAMLSSKVQICQFTIPNFKQLLFACCFPRRKVSNDIKANVLRFSFKQAFR